MRLLRRKDWSSLSRSYPKKMSALSTICKRLILPKWDKISRLTTKRLAKDRKKWRSCEEKFEQGFFTGIMQIVTELRVDVCWSHWKVRIYAISVCTDTHTDTLVHTRTYTHKIHICTQYTQIHTSMHTITHNICKVRKQILEYSSIIINDSIIKQGLF